ncbi:MAG: hypothetical protein AAF571_10515, partial [Verrucomicrobiota bacterium]
TTSKYKFTTADGKTGNIELPKDIHATGIKIKTSSGATIEADQITSIGRVDQTIAQGDREEKVIPAVGDAVGSGIGEAAKHAVRP